MNQRLKLMGEVEGKVAMILIDYRATHNFLGPDIIRRAGIKVTKTKEYEVLVSNGGKHLRRGICLAVTVKIGDFGLTEDFLPIEMGSLLVILGIKWLMTLGVM